MTGTIVVGVDGSPTSVAALRWALARATAEHRAVTAVEVHVPDQFAPGTSYAPAPYGRIPPERHRTSLREIVAEVVGTTGNAPEITELRRSGDPGVELARAAQGAEMLVLGHTPHGRTSEYLFGQVTSECLRHADVPVVLVPASAHP